MRLPNLRGARKMADLLCSIENALGTPPMRTVSMTGCYKMIADRRSATERGAYYLGSYDDAVVALLRTLVTPGSTVLDIGANIGFFSVPLGLQAATCGGRLVAFEPVPANNARLQQNIELNRLSDIVTVEQLGASSSATSFPMTLREDFAAGAATGNAAIAIDGGDSCFEQIQIRTVQLDDYVRENRLERISLMKIDTEGHENEVLRGARATIARDRPVVLMEVSPSYYERKRIDFYASVLEAVPEDYEILSVQPTRSGVLAPRGSSIRLQPVTHRDAFLVEQDVLMGPREIVAGLQQNGAGGESRAGGSGA